jgi:hypothetical protein
MRIVGVLTAAIALALPSPPTGAASVTPTRCANYLIDDSGVPASVRARMVQKNDSAAEACTDSSANLTSYASMSPVWKGALGVCIFTRGRFSFENTDPRLIRAEGPESTFMAVDDPNCPKQNDRRFIEANGITEGVFLALLKLVDDLTSSRTGFDSRLVSARGETNQRSYEQLRSDLLSKNPANRFDVREINLGQQVDFRKRDTLAYSLKFASRAYCGRLHELVVDLSSSGLGVVGFETIQLTGLDRPEQCP